jgi:hypothetical protein
VKERLVKSPGKGCGKMWQNVAKCGKKWQAVMGVRLWPTFQAGKDIEECG